MLKRFLVFSDVHMHEWSYGATVLDSGYNSRLIEQRNALSRIAEYAYNHKISHVFFCGDLFHSTKKLTPQVLNATWVGLNCISDVSELILLRGNHDTESLDGTIHALSVFNDIAMVRHMPFFAGKGIAYVPWAEDSSTLDAWLNIANKCDLLFGHFGLSGVPMGSGFVKNEHLDLSRLRSKLPDTSWAFLGHYHQPWINGKTVMVGSLTQQSFSDADDTGQNLRGFVDFNDGKVTWIDSGAPTFFKGSWDKLQTAMTKDTSNRIKYIRLTNYKKEDVTEIRDKALKHGAVKVEFEAQSNKIVQKRVANAPTFDPTHVYSTYVKQHNLTGHTKRVGDAIMENKYDSIRETKD